MKNEMAVSALLYVAAVAGKWCLKYLNKAIRCLGCVNLTCTQLRHYVIALFPKFAQLFPKASVQPSASLFLFFCYPLTRSLDLNSCSKSRRIFGRAFIPPSGASGLW